MAFTKTPMTIEERKARRRAASLKHYYANIEVVRASQNERKRKNPEKTKLQRRSYRAANLEKYREYGRKEQMLRKVRYPWKNSLAASSKRAAKSGIEYALTQEWAAQAYTGVCAVTGISFVIDPVAGKPGPRPYSPSIDRINNDLGYIPENCRFVLAAVNALKHTGTDADMVAIARAIVAYAPALN